MGIDADLRFSERFRPMYAEPLPAEHPPLDDSWPEGIVHLGGVRLADLARPGMRAVIAFTDATRYSPDRLLVGWLLQELESCGISSDHITLLCATGLHRPMTPQERERKLGGAIAGAMRIADHDAMSPEGIVRLGEVSGIPVTVNRLCAEADLLLAVGVVEPHQYAGYSGGSKTVVIGCGGEETIAATHGSMMLDDPGTRLGAIEGNPFQQGVRAAGEMIGLDYILNVLLDGKGRIIAAAAGPPRQVHDHLIALARPICESPVPRMAHLAMAGVSDAKSVNLYQASRAATYLALAEGTPLLPGAPIILRAAIPEGAGEGTGEKRFFEILSGAGSPGRLIDQLRRSGFPAGAQRAYVLAQALVRHPVIVAGALHPDIVAACHMISVPDADSALNLAASMARSLFGVPASEPLDLLVVSDALMALPRLASSSASA